MEKYKEQPIKGAAVKSGNQFDAANNLIHNHPTRDLHGAGTAPPSQLAITNIAGVAAPVP